MENLERMCTVTTGAEGFMFEILSEKRKKRKPWFILIRIKIKGTLSA